jgi:glycogen synthase
MVSLALPSPPQGVEGIVNGMDVEEWDPRADKYLTVRYDKTNVHAGKAAAKAALQVGPARSEEGGVSLLILAFTCTEAASSLLIS